MPANNRNPTFEPTIAQQIFAISSGIAGGIAGLILARRLIGAQAVPRRQVIGAALISAVATAGSIYLIRPIQTAA